jgi:hypothetical protein
MQLASPEVTSLRRSLACNATQHAIGDFLAHFGVLRSFTGAYEMMLSHAENDFLSQIWHCK